MKTEDFKFKIGDEVFVIFKGGAWAENTGIYSGIVKGFQYVERKYENVLSYIVKVEHRCFLGETDSHDVYSIENVFSSVDELLKKIKVCNNLKNS